MKKLFARVLAIMCVLSTCLSCEETLIPEIQPDSETPAANHFTATTESPTTKTELQGNDTEGYMVKWQSGDKITIVDGAATPNVGVYTTTSTAVTADFTFVSESGTEAQVAPYKAYYPETLYEDGTLTLPWVQFYKAGNIAEAPMYAESTNKNLSFKNLCGIIRLNISTTMSGKKARRITLTSDNHGLSGTFTISADGAAVVSAPDGVVLSCGADGVDINGEAKPFYIAVPAASYSRLKITLTTLDGSYQTLTSKSDIVVERSKITDITLSFNNLTDEDSQLTVYDGTKTNSYVPFYGYYADQRLKCEFIIPADQLRPMSGLFIRQMKFYLQSPENHTWAGGCYVFMNEVNATAINSYYGWNGVQSVYWGGDAGLDSEGYINGGPLSVSNHIMTISFNSTYLYTGGNLLIGVYWLTPCTYESSTFYGQEIEGACVQGHGVTLDAATANQRNFLPKTTFVFGKE